MKWTITRLWIICKRCHDLNKYHVWNIHRHIFTTTLNRDGPLFQKCDFDSKFIIIFSKMTICFISGILCVTIACGAQPFRWLYRLANLQALLFLVFLLINTVESLHLVRAYSFTCLAVSQRRSHHGIGHFSLVVWCWASHRLDYFMHHFRCVNKRMDDHHFWDSLIISIFSKWKYWRLPSIMDEYCLCGFISNWYVDFGSFWLLHQYVASITIVANDSIIILVHILVVSIVLWTC